MHVVDLKIILRISVLWHNELSIHLDFRKYGGIALFLYCIKAHVLFTCHSRFAGFQDKEPGAN